MKWTREELVAGLEAGQWPEVKMRYSAQETGWAAHLGGDLYVIANTPVMSNLGCLDVVRALKGDGTERCSCCLHIVEVVQQTLAVKEAIEYAPRDQATYAKLRDALRQAHCEIEGLLPGFAVVSHDGTVNVLAILASIGQGFELSPGVNVEEREN